MLRDYDAAFLYHGWFSFIQWWGCQPFWQDVSVKLLTLRRPLRPVTGNADLIFWRSNKLGKNYLCNSDETGCLSDCLSLMLGNTIPFIKHSQAMLERGVCELAHFFHSKIIWLSEFYNLQCSKFLMLDIYGAITAECKWIVLYTVSPCNTVVEVPVNETRRKPPGKIISSKTKIQERYPLYENYAY